VSDEYTWKPGVGFGCKADEFFDIVEKVIEFPDVTALAGGMSMAHLIMGIHRETSLSEKNRDFFVSSAVLAETMDEHHQSLRSLRLPGTEE
jgi:hypothetical protein